MDEPIKWVKAATESECLRRKRSVSMVPSAEVRDANEQRAAEQHRCKCSVATAITYMYHFSRVAT